MKKNSLNFFLIILLFALTACSDDKQEPILEINLSNLDFIKESITKSVNVRTNYKDWQAVVSETGREWCTATPDNNILRVTVNDNAGSVVRETEIKITAGVLSETIYVKQLGSDPAILLSTKEIPAKVNGETISFNITTNVVYEITGTPEWMEELASADTRLGMETHTHQFKVERNTSEESRSATLVIKDTNSTCSTQVVISQKGTKYTPESSGIKDDIKIKVIRGVASSSHNGSGPEGGIELSFDGKMDTWYHSQWSGKVKEGYFPITLDYYLEDAEVLDYLVYHPRSNHSNGNFKEVDIYVKYKDNTAFKHILSKDFKGLSTATRINFDDPLLNVEAIRFSVKSGVGDDGHGFASCSEMEFYKKNADNFNPLLLFTDNTCSELKPGITEKDINDCELPLFRNLAMHLLNGTYPAEFRISEYKAYPHPDTESKANKTGQYSLLDNPTGISVKEGEELVVLVGPTNNFPLSLRVQNLDEPNGDGFYTASSYLLMEGVNRIVPRNKGLVYLMYHTEDFKNAPVVKIHIPTGVVNGYFDSTKHTESDWTRLLNNATDKYFDVLGRYAHLTFPTKRFRDHTGSRGKDLIDIYDRVVYLQMEHMGLEKYNRMFNNRMYFSVIYTSYMYAAAYHTGYHEGTLTLLSDPVALVNGARDNIWGPAHEVGHINQTRPGLKWVGTTEVTNNIHSMYVQREFGKPTRLQEESMANEGGFTNRYEKAMNLYFRSGRPHCYMTTDSEKDLVDVFCKLVPFWQLQLYVSDAQGNKDFYKDLYEMVREEPDMKSEAGHQLEFVVRASKAAKLNLIDFFERWGFLTEVDVKVEDYSPAQMTITKEMIDEIKKRIEKLGYPAPAHRFEYICDNNMEIFKSTAPVVKGSATLTGKTLKMTDWKNVVAYEVYNGDNLVFVSSESKFTLDNTIPYWLDSYELYAVSSTGEKVKVNLQVVN